jgi:hypothetical protein
MAAVNEPLIEILHEEEAISSGIVKFSRKIERLYLLLALNKRTNEHSLQICLYDLGKGMFQSKFVMENAVPLFKMLQVDAVHVRIDYRGNCARIQRNDRTQQWDLQRVNEEESVQAKLDIYELQQKFSIWEHVGSGVSLGCFNSSVKLSTFPLQPHVPSTASEILIHVRNRSGSESPNAWFYADVYTMVQKKKQFQRLSGWHYPQNAISYNSENMIFPLSDDRNVYVEVVDTPHSNDHGGEVILLAYR